MSKKTLRGPLLSSLQAIFFFPIPIWRDDNVPWGTTTELSFSFLPFFSDPLRLTASLCLYFLPCYCNIQLSPPLKTPITAFPPFSTDNCIHASPQHHRCSMCLSQCVVSHLNIHKLSPPLLLVELWMLRLALQQGAQEHWFFPASWHTEFLSPYSMGCHSHSFEVS